MPPHISYPRTVVKWLIWPPGKHRQLFDSPTAFNRWLNQHQPSFTNSQCLHSCPLPQAPSEGQAPAKESMELSSEDHQALYMYGTSQEHCECSNAAIPREHRSSIKRDKQGGIPCFPQLHSSALSYFPAFITFQCALSNEVCPIIS